VADAPALLAEALAARIAAMIGREDLPARARPVRPGDILVLVRRRTAFIQRLEEMGYDRDRMDDMRRLIDAPKSDIFDVLAYVRFTLEPLSRAERVEGAKTTGLDGHQTEMREFLSYILQAYELQGIDELAPHRISDFLQIRYGGTNDAKRVLGSIPTIRNAFIEIQKHLFS
jgi:type I restriction enzyme R subunit